VIATVAAHQIRSFARQRVVWVMLVTMLVMAALAGVIGWSSHRTIIGVYDEAVKILAATGQPAPGNPFVLKPQLSLLSNVVIYITLIGALLALLIGHLSVIEDDSGGIGRLVFSRQVTRASYVTGKMVGAGAVLAATVATCWVVSALSLWIVNGAPPSGADLVRVGVFYLASWLYLAMFALVGMVAALLTHRRSIGLLSAVGVWLVITFVLPQFTSGLRPTASLNPITDPVSTSQAFFRVTSRIRPLSLVEQYKQFSGRMLRTAPAETVPHTFVRLAPLLGAVVLLAWLALVLVQRHDYSGSADSE
jgi:ABC-type transport system involved in multi-copper enzyme maturation permease subunit